MFSKYFNKIFNLFFIFLLINYIKSNDLPISSWDAIQSKYKDAVVQVFTQVAEFNWLEPYKSPEQKEWLGSGFIINDQGYIITNAHVVNGAIAVSIQMPPLGKRKIEVKIEKVCYDRDLALLKIKDSELDFVKSKLGSLAYVNLGDSNNVKRTDQIMLMGYPLGMMFLKSTIGVVSGIESIMSRLLIQIDAAANPGNSGGPIFDIYGNVIGVHVAGIRGVQGVGYMIPVNELKLILHDLYSPVKDKILRKPYLGIIGNYGSEALTYYLSNPMPGGCYVADVCPGSVLYEAGIRSGDLIYAVDNYPIDIYADVSVPWCEDKISVTDYISFIPLDKKIDFLVYRNGERKEFVVDLQKFSLPAIRTMYPEYEKIDYEVIGGMVIMQLTINHVSCLYKKIPEFMKYDQPKNQVDPILIISHILPDSQAQRVYTFSVGTLIQEVNGIKVNTLDHFRAAVKKSLSTGFLSIKSVDKVLAAFYFDKILEDEAKLSQIYKYPISPFVEYLIKEHIANNEKKTPGFNTKVTAS